MATTELNGVRAEVRDTIVLAAEKDATLHERLRGVLKVHRGYLRKRFDHDEYIGRLDERVEHLMRHLRRSAPELAKSIEVQHPNQVDMRVAAWAATKEALNLNGDPPSASVLPVYGHAETDGFGAMPIGSMRELF